MPPEFVFKGALQSRWRWDIRASWFGMSEFFQMAPKGFGFSRLPARKAFELPFDKHADAAGNEYK